MRRTFSAVLGYDLAVTVTITRLASNPFLYPLIDSSAQFQLPKASPYLPTTYRGGERVETSFTPTTFVLAFAPFVGRHNCQRKVGPIGSTAAIPVPCRLEVSYHIHFDKAARPRAGATLFHDHQSPCSTSDPSATTLQEGPCDYENHRYHMNQEIARPNTPFSTSRERS